MSRRSIVRWMWAIAFSALAADAAAAADAPPPIYRVFLRDGTTLSAFGEWARVGDHIVFSVPIGDGPEAPLHLATLPVDRVDWPATEQYRDGLRAAQYVATRGDQDFAELSDQVAQLLNDAGKTSDVAVRLTKLEDARRRLAEWPSTHFAYRSDEVRQVLTLVDEVLSDLRASRGDSRFDLNLVAWTAPPPAPQPLPPPTLRDAVSQALRLAQLTDSPVERVSLLRATGSVLEQRRRTVPEPWMAGTREMVERELTRELEIDQQYSAVQSRELKRTQRASERGDVRAVERSLARVRAADERLGGARPDVTRALLQALEERLDAAQRLRLARDGWVVKSASFERYTKASKGSFADFARLRPALDDIKALAGPNLSRLARMESIVFAVQTKLSSLDVPSDLRAAHALAVSAVQLAASAARLRREAIETGNMQPARDASAAAAGAQLLFERASADLRRALTPP